MAIHSSFRAWRIPLTEEPGRLQSMGSQIVRHDLVTEQQQPKLNIHLIIVNNSKIQTYMQQDM